MTHVPDAATDHNPSPEIRDASSQDPWCILVVDDEPDMAELIRQMFRREIVQGTHAFAFAENGVQALEMIDAKPDTDVVLSDINMPKMDGITLLGRINDRYPLIKTIIITAYGDMANIRAAMNRGAFDFLNKPIQFRDLKVTLNRTISTVEKLKALEAERRRARRTQKKLRQLATEAARASGRAEYATSVIHNISNVLNSLNASCAHLDELMRNPGLEGLMRANELLAQNLDDLGSFFSSSDKGEKLARFYLKIEEILEEVRADMVDEIQSIRDRTLLMADFIEAQQFDEKAVGPMSAMELHALLHEALAVKENALRRHDIEVVTQFDEALQIRANRSMLIQVVINLIQNGIEAMEHSARRKLTVVTGRDQSGRPICSVSDTGEGIPEGADLFSRGYTTKQRGHGYGLHFCHRAMETMGGAIEVDSSQEGAAFTLIFAPG